MYLKVHKKNNHWFRDDNETLLGEYVAGSPGCHYVNFKDNKLPISKGYLDVNGSFIPICTINPKFCNYYCGLMHSSSYPAICPCKHSNEPTLGYYVNIPKYLDP